MRRILKYEIPATPGPIAMPRGARLLHCHEQDGGIFVWAECDPEEVHVRRHLGVAPTGAVVGEAGIYVGTVHLLAESLVFHIYDYGEAGA